MYSMLWCVPCCGVLHGVLLHSVVLHGLLFYGMACFICVVCYKGVLPGVVLHHTVLHGIVLHRVLLCLWCGVLQCGTVS